MTPTRDRRIHAKYPGMEIVRYDRAGKWYAEPTIGCLKRQALTIEDAVEVAVFAAQAHGGTIAWGRPGGTTFDQKLRERLA